MEESISLEETNKIRESLGLKPIPAPSVEDRKEEEPPQPGSNEELSLEDTNRIRKSLGLRPIEPESTVSSAPLSTEAQEAQAHANWVKKHEAETKQKRQEELREKIKATKEKAELRSRQRGRTLGELSEDEDNSALGFLERLKQRTSKKNQKPQADAQQENKNEEQEYTSEDLTGIKVGHKIEDFKGLSEGTVLTLREQDVLDEQAEDQLEASVLVEKKRMAQNMKNKKGDQKYKSYDDDEFGDSAAMHDDSDDDSKNQDYFVLDGASKLPAANNDDQERQQSNVQKESIYFEMAEVGHNDTASDYKKQKPVKFKKPKKIAPKARKRLRLDDEERNFDPSAMTTNDLEDDSDLQALLTLNRRKVQKREAKTSPEDIAEKVMQYKDVDNSAKKDTGGLVLSTVTEFVSSINPDNQEEVPEGNEPAIAERVEDHTSQDQNLDHEVKDTEMKEEGDESGEVAQESSVHVDASAVAPEEASVSGGVGNVLKLLQSRGVIKKKDDSELERERKQKEQKEWNNRMHKERVARELELQRRKEQDRMSGKYDTLSLKEREMIAAKENRERELEEARLAQKRFENYNPEVDIRYYDDDGRELSTKEAYKQLAQQFHGKTPGKHKLEKRIHKISEEKKVEAAPIFDSNNTSTKSGVRLQ